MLNTTKSEAQTEDTTESRYFLDDPTLFSQKQALIYIYDASTYSHIKTIRVSGDLFDISFYFLQLDLQENILSSIPAQI